MGSPIVSVVIPTFNREALLPRALESVCAQTFGDWEIVVVDDGSTDNTPQLLQQWSARLGDRLRCVRQANAGSSAARDRGIDAARGSFVCFLDSDDEFLPTKLERQLALFHRRPELGFVFSDYAYVTLDGQRHASAWADMCPQAQRVAYAEVEPGLCVCRGDLFETLLEEYFIATIVGMVRREVLGSQIRFPVGLAYAEEWLFYLKVVRACPSGFVREALSLHHCVANSLARTDRRRNVENLYELLRHMCHDLAPLTPRHRRIISRRMAVTARQIGYDLYRLGDYRAAAQRFGQAFRHHPGPGAAANWLDARLRALTARRAPVGTQEPAAPVR